ncbi:MAG: 2-C-methyl-D-erythritol 2,4-cyclodiphosphate synthase [Bacillota bacterium]|nr:2-C-methyl-D-erythritol 2,4-cyclodiphosphate synthase [Bacillota bacterium]
MKISAIVAAAGSGRRLGKEKNKILLYLGSKIVLSYSLELLSAQSAVTEIIIAAAAGEEKECEAIAEKACGITPFKVVTGGAERMNSVYKALKEVGSDCDYVMIQDGARPFLTSELLDRVIKADFKDGVIPALPLKETVKEAEGDIISATIPRNRLYSAQTPQLFPKEILLRAYEEGLMRGIQATDDASLVESLGGEVSIVAGSEENIKITTPYDWERAQERTKGSMLRIGSGFDVHAFTKGRPLILGGEVIPYELGLAGHSDADVATHALMDAILGAMAAGDIGGHFPPSDPRYKDADSIKLLEYICRLMAENNYQIINTDITIIAEKPKMAPHIKAMRSNLAQALGVAVDAVSIKATTTEKLGFTGRGEGIAAQATVLLEKR